MNSPSVSAVRDASASVTPPPASASFFQRLAQSAALLLLALVLTLLLGLALLSSSSLVREAIQPLFRWNENQDVLAGWLTLGFIVIAHLDMLLLAWRLRLRSWAWIGGSFLALVPVLVYLAVDDPTILHPTTIDEIAPAFPGAEKSYEVLMRYSKQYPSAEARAFDEWKQRIVGLPVSPDKPKEWTEFLQKNRAAIEADWADLAPQRRWIAELNAFDRLGDLGTASPDANIITFKVWRSISQRTLHVAGLHVLDGRPDEAIATLLPMLQTSRKLQPSARTLVRFMIGIVIEKMTTLYAIDIVEHTTVSAEMKAELAAAISGGVRGEAGARRLIGIEQSLSLGYFDQPIGDLLTHVSLDRRGPAIRPLLNWVSPCIYNPRRTINLMGELNSELQDLAARRESLKGSRAEAVYAEKTRPRFKNFVGAVLIDLATPAYTKVVVAYWDLHDNREKLAGLLAAGK